MLNILNSDTFGGYNPNLLDDLSCKLSEQLTLFEVITDSPELRQALTHAELIISRIRAYYNAAQVNCRQAIQSGVQFATSLSNLVNCIGLGTVETTKFQTQDFPKPDPILDWDKCELQQMLMQAFYIMKQFSQQTNDFVIKLEDLQHVLLRAINHLNRLFEIRSKFQRTYDQLEVALNRAASVNAVKTGTDLADVDEMVVKALQSYKLMSSSYLAHVRTAFGSGHLATYLRLLVIVLSGECVFTDQMYSMFNSVSMKQTSFNQSDNDHVNKNNKYDEESTNSFYFDNCTLVSRLQQLANVVESYQGECSAKLNYNGLNNVGDKGLTENDEGSKFVEGYLFKRSGKRGFRNWSRRWFRIFNNQLIYCKRFSGLKTIDLQAASDLAFSEINYQISDPNTRNSKLINGILNNDFENGPLAHYLLQAIPKWNVLEPDLRFCTARVCLNKNKMVRDESVNHFTQSINERRFTFELVSSDNKIHYLQASNADDFNIWFSALQSGLTDIYNLNISPQKNKYSERSMLYTRNQNNQRINSATVNINYDIFRSQGSILLTYKPDWSQNTFCADCNVEGSSWASINLGVTLCTQCASIHRGLGVQVSKIRSLTLDNWQPENLHVMINLGNRLVNELYESNWPAFSKDYPRISATCTSEKRRYWIRAKYVNCSFSRLPLGNLGSSKQSDSFHWLRKLYSDWIEMKQQNLKNYHKLIGQSVETKPDHSSVIQTGDEQILSNY